MVAQDTSRTREEKNLQIIVHTIATFSDLPFDISTKVWLSEYLKGTLFYNQFVIFNLLFETKICKTQTKISLISYWSGFITHLEGLLHFYNLLAIH